MTTVTAERDVDELPVVEAVEVVPRHEVDALVRGIEDQLTTLEAELQAAEEAAAAAELEARRSGADPAALSRAEERLAALRAQLVEDAEGYARHVTDAARRAAAAIKAGPLDQPASAAGDPGVEPVAPPPEVVPEPRPTTPVISAAAPTPSVVAAVESRSVFADAHAPAVVASPPTITVPLAPSVSPATEVPRHDQDEHRPYARTVGMLQVVLWSIVIAAVLIVLLAWFA